MTARAFTVVLPAAVLAWLAWADGGYYPQTWGALLVGEALVVAAAALVARSLELDRHGGLLVAGLLAFAAWAVLSRAWALAPDGAVLEAERALVYVGAVGAALLTVPRSRANYLVLGVLAGTGVVTVGGLAVHALGSGTPSERLELPLGYANGAGILAAVALLLGLGLSVEGPAGGRAAAAALCPPAGVVLYLSLSRGAVLAGVVGLLVLVVAGRSSPGLVRGALVAVVTAVAVGLVAAADAFSIAGRAVGEVAWLGLLAVLAGVAGACGVLRGETGPTRLRRRALRFGAFGLAALTVVAVVAAAVVSVRGDRSAPAGQQGAPSRLLSSSTSYRADYWDVAAAAVRDEPVLGIGAGGFERRWLRDRQGLHYVRDAHNVYLETLAELGPVGLALLLGVVLLPLVGMRTALEHATGRAALAAYTALLSHAMLDWDWELPAVTLCTLTLAVALVRLGGTGWPRAPGWGLRAGLLACAVVLAAVGLDVRSASEATARAHEALDGGAVGRARNEARTAHRLTPWAAEPWQLLGEAELAAGRISLGRRYLRRAARDDPAAFGAWLALAFATEGSERDEALARARALNPLAPELGVFVAEDPSKG